MTVGTRIKFFRRRKNWTQKALAQSVGKEASFISHIERSTRNLSVRLLCSIAKALEVPPMILLSGGTHPFEQCVEKISCLDEQNLHRISEYADYLLALQIRNQT
ncbi:MAG: helix-turn-helix transcriptional regulator [Candidatus Omnitrophica bacterium]|nr:helix-turn-helix transcriptional regulator [Candidatus Omnitrophota bacterium]